MSGMGGLWMVGLVNAIAGNRADAIATSVVVKIYNDIKSEKEFKQTFQELSEESQKIYEQLLQNTRNELEDEEIKQNLLYLCDKQSRKALKQRLKDVSGFDQKQELKKWVEERLSNRIPQDMRVLLTGLFLQMYADYLKRLRPDLYREWFAQEWKQQWEQRDKKPGSSNKAEKEENLHFLTALPARVDDTYFLHREKDVEAVRQILTTEKQVVLINGLGGIGKTTIARKLFYQMESAYPYVAWVGYEGNLKESLQKSLKLFAEEPITAEERWELLWNFLLENREKVLLFLDNANKKRDGKKVEADSEFTQLRSSGMTMVVTSRLSSLVGFRKHLVGFLDEDACVDIFYCYYTDSNQIEEQNRGEEGIVRELIREKIRCHTFSVELLAKYARHKVHGGISQLKAELDQKDFFYPADISEYTDHEGEDSPIAIQLAKLFDISTYPEGMQRIAKCFSILPSEDIPKELAQHIQAEEQDFYELIQLGLLKDNGDSYSMQPVVQESIRYQVDQGMITLQVADCETCIDRLSDADYLNELNFYNAEQKIGYIDAFRNYFHTEKERKQRCVQFLWYAGGEIYNRIGLPLKALPYYEENLKIARKLSEESPTASNQRDLSVSLNKLGDVWVKLGKEEEALKAYEEGLEIIRKLSEESPTASNQRDLSVSLYKLGNLYLQLGHYQSAVDILQEAVDGLDMVRMQSQYMVREEEIQIVESALHLAQLLDALEGE